MAAGDELTQGDEGTPLLRPHGQPQATFSGQVVTEEPARLEGLQVVVVENIDVIIDVSDGLTAAGTVPAYRSKISHITLR
jgi:hypothetical protein